jgi:hypothetical protein
MSSTERLERLTPAQEARLPAIRDKWVGIGLSTEPADRPRAEAAVRLAYRRAGLAEPTDIMWTGSPMAGATTAASVTRRQRQGLPAAAEVRSQVTCQVTSRASNLVAGRVSTRVRAEVMDHVARQVAGRVWAPVRRQIEQLSRPTVGAGYGQHDAPWLAFFDALGQCGVDVSPLDGLTQIAAACGWWWPFRDLCILTERHSRLACDPRGRLHAPAGPAVEYPDGWSVYAWHGVGVTAATILHPEMITIAQIKREANAHVRRVLIERYGFGRYIMDTGTLPFHADDTGTLYRCDLGGHEPLVVVSLLNGARKPHASRKQDVLRVPPHVTEARQAVAWTFDQAVEDYRPALET